MKKLILLVAFLPFLVTGCVVADWLFGVKKGPDGTVQPQPTSPASSIGGLFGGVIGAAISGLGGIYAAVRGKQWANAAEAAVAGVNAIKAELTPAQKAKMIEIQEKAGAVVRQRVRALAQKLENKGNVMSG